MRKFIKLMLKHVAPYKGYVKGAAAINILSAILNIFSFFLIIPMLQILFKISNTVYEYIPWSTVEVSLKEKIVNNAYFWANTYMGKNGESMTLFLICIFIIVMTLLKTTLFFGSGAIMVPIKTGIVRDLRVALYKKILELPISFFSQERKGDILARISGDVGEVEFTITNTLELLIKNPILIIFYSGILLYTSFELTLFTVVFVPLMAWIIGVVGRHLKRGSWEAQVLWSDTISQIEETLGGLRIIKAFNAENKMDARFCDTSEKMRNKTIKVAVRQSSAHPISELLGTIMLMITLGFGGSLILKGQLGIDAPTFIFFITILYSVINPIKEIARASYSIPKGMVSLERIQAILKTENNITDPENPKELTDFKDKISFTNVNFFYDVNTKKQILENLTFDIEKGKTIAIVGASGAGKSTLVDLIPRFYDPTEGTVKIDGTDIREYRVSDVRALIGNVNQEPILFNDTIFNNIAFGADNATEEQVIQAAKIANAHQFIIEKEEGYNTCIGDRGIRLSGGQRQRLSIARAILKNPPILILDEATASLDTKSERVVQEALDRLMSSRTTIAIAHRLSTIKNADEIIVIDKGKIVERGTHDQLIKQDGHYTKLYKMQAL